MDDRGSSVLLAAEAFSPIFQGLCLNGMQDPNLIYEHNT